MSAAQGQDSVRPVREEGDPSRPVRVPGPYWRLVVYGLTAAGIFLSVNQIFHLQLFIGVVVQFNQYLYLILGLFLSLVFICFPASRRAARDRVPWYDVGLFLATLGATGYFAYNALNIIERAWEFIPPDHALVMSYIVWGLLLEAVRRAGGWTIFFIILVASLYPTYADRVPGPIEGLPATIGQTASYHIMSIESVLGIPMRAFAQLVIGFLVFGVALQHTGGGRFFINLAFALLGHVRGGPAKVSIFASGLMGSMSGSVITNVLTTGTLSIPAMRRTGFSRQYAAGVEACASTGGVLMPPVMGATAFVMASFLNIPYIHIAAAAVVPSVLYFFGLFMQIDAYSARHRLAGLPREELPDIRHVLKTGWYYIFVFVLLVWLLVFLRREAMAPFYATALLLAINQFSREYRMGWRDFLDFLFAAGRLLAELTAILGAVGLIVGALVVTGMAGTLANDLVFLARGEPLLLLLMGALTSFVLGIGMTVTAAYIFLAVVLAPALVRVGFEPMAVHLFILYWGMLSFITPPVALGAFAAASVAGANAMRTALEAMRLGSIIYFVPFFFVLNPALILQGTWQEVVVVCATALVGVGLISAALQGYLLGIGRLGRGALGLGARVLLVFGGLSFAVPGGGAIAWSPWTMTLIAVALSLPALVLGVLDRKMADTR